jgi:hypothetical protein
MEALRWWTVVRDWFRRVVMGRAGRTAPTDWFEQLFSFGEIEDGAPPSGHPVLPAPAVESLTRQLNALTPWHVRVDVESRVQGTAVRCRSRLGFGASAQGVSDESPLTHLLNVLHGVQTFMVELTKRAWPASDRLSKHERQADWEAWIRRRPLPDGVVEDGEARLWFGDRDRPVLELNPIRLR